MGETWFRARATKGPEVLSKVNFWHHEGVHDERIKRCRWPKKKYRKFENSVKRKMNNEDICDGIVLRTIKAILFLCVCAQMSGNAEGQK